MARKPGSQRVDNIRDPEVGEPQSSLNQIEKIVRKSVTLRDGGFSWLPEAEAAEPEDASYVFQGHRPPPNSTVHQRPFPPQHRFDFPSHEHHGRSGRRVREGRKSKPGVQCMMNENVWWVESYSVWWVELRLGHRVVYINSSTRLPLLNPL